MRRVIRTLAVLTLLGLGLYGTIHGFRPKLKVKAPTSRYHGYKLNYKAIQATKARTVLISLEGFASHGRGTGVLLNGSYVLTCSHVVAQEDAEIWIYLYPGYLVDRGHVVYRDAKKDLALVKLDIPIRGVPLAAFQTEVGDGEPITIIGNALGSMKWFVSYGIIGGRTARDLLTDGTVVGGNSGGPWINEKGEIVALSAWGYTTLGGAPIGINGGISARTILEFLASAYMSEIRKEQEVQ